MLASVKTDNFMGPRIRSKTQKKNTRDFLPELKPSKRFITLDTSCLPSPHLKLSQKTAIKQICKKTRQEVKKVIDENYYRVASGKNTVKFSRKKMNNEHMIVQQINPNGSKKSLSSNIVSYAYDQYQGLRQYNEDRIIACQNIRIRDKNYNVFAVFDGHGGSLVSQHLKTNFIQDFILQMNENPMLDVLENLRKVIYKIQERILGFVKTKSMIGGTCASILIICENLYYICHLGDSRIMKVNLQVPHQTFSQMTTDHKPEDKEERNRIQKNGGKVYRNLFKLPDGSEMNGPFRVYPGRLSVSRTIGDLEAKQQANGKVVCCEPELIKGKIEQKCLFLLFTDGAYEKFENNEIVEYFTKCKIHQEAELRKSIQFYFINSMLRESSDNVSLISVLVNQYCQLGNGQKLVQLL